MKHTDPQIKIRMPPDLKAWLAIRAAHNCRPQSTEIVHSLETIRRAETKAAGETEAHTDH